MSLATHPHLELDRTMTSVPKVFPGDMVFWHGDVVHAVEEYHTGSGPSAGNCLGFTARRPINDNPFVLNSDVYPGCSIYGSKHCICGEAEGSIFRGPYSSRFPKRPRGWLGRNWESGRHIQPDGEESHGIICSRCLISLRSNLCLINVNVSILRVIMS